MIVGSAWHEGMNDKVRRRLHPRKPSALTNTGSCADLDLHPQSIIDYLECVHYGEEESQALQLCSSLSSNDKLAELPWNILFRVWLLQLRMLSLVGNEKETVATCTSDILSKILVSLRFEVLLQSDSVNNNTRNNDGGLWTTDLMDLHSPTKHDAGNTTSSCWQRDKMLVFWKQHQRYHIIQDLKTHANHRLKHSEQLYIVEIVSIIDQITGYQASDSFATNSDAIENTHQTQAAIADSTKSIVLDVLEDFHHTQNNLTNGPEIDTNDKEYGHQQSRTGTNHSMTQSCPDFCKWIQSKLQDSKQPSESQMQQLLDLYKVVGKQGSQGEMYQRVAQSITLHAKDPESRACLAQPIQWLTRVHPNNDSDDLIRGKALCLDLLLCAGIVTENTLMNTSTHKQNAWKDVNLTASSSNSVESMIKTVRNFLLVQPRQSGMPPNVGTLQSHLWDIALRNGCSSSTIVKIMESFQDWLPLQRLVPRYRSSLMESLSLVTLHNDATNDDTEDEDSSTTSKLSKDIMTDNKGRQCASVQVLTSLALLACNNDAATLSLDVLDKEVLYQKVLPLFFHHSLLSCIIAACVKKEEGKPMMMTTTTTKRDAVPIHMALDIIQSMSCFIEVLECLAQAPGCTLGCEQGFLSIIPMIMSLKPSLESTSDEWQDHYNDIVTAMKKNDTRLNEIYDRSGGEPDAYGSLLDVGEFWDALVEFCQAQRTCVNSEWCELVVKQCLSKCKKKKMDQIWIAAVLKSLNQKRRVPLASNFLMEFHKCLIEKLYECSSATSCLLESVMSEYEKAKSSKDNRYENGLFLHKAVACILEMSSAHCFFPDDAPLAEVLARALSCFSNFENDSASLGHVLVAVAVHLKSLSKSKEANEMVKGGNLWMQCALQVRKFLLLIVRSRWRAHFETWHEKVSATIASVGSNESRLWWRESTLDLLTCCGHRCDVWLVHGEDSAVLGDPMLIKYENERSITSSSPGGKRKRPLHDYSLPVSGKLRFTRPLSSHVGPAADMESKHVETSNHAKVRKYEPRRQRSQCNRDLKEYSSNATQGENDSLCDDAFVHADDEDELLSAGSECSEDSDEILLLKL